MKKYKRGYTTGVFDLFHVGHLNILKKAKQQCEYLIVGVSTDELVRQYKNKDTVIPFDERKLIVESIKYVDEVVAQEDRDKLGAFFKIGFDAVFVGDDWKSTPFFNEIEKKYKEVGVDLVYFPYTKGTSSTKLSGVLDEILNNRE